MKKLRLLLCLLIVVCIIASSSTFSAMPKGKFPIRFRASSDTPNQYEKELMKHLEITFSKSSYFRISNDLNEDRIILMFIVDRHIPGIVSTDVLASATPINTFSLVWLAKPADKHAYFIWHSAGTFQTPQDLAQYIHKQAIITATKIRNNYSYLFD
jgi:hypothetical protein